MTERSGILIKELDDGLPELTFPPGFNAADVFIDRHVAEGRGDRLVIRGIDTDVSYKTLAENVNRFGNAMRRLKLQRGARLLMVMADGPEFFYVFWGAVKFGIVPVPINTLLRARDLAWIMRDSGCAAVVYSSEFATEVMAGAAAAGCPDVMMLDSAQFSAEAAGESCALESVRAGAEEDCFWLYSSGTTGEPKGVVHAHASLAAVCYLFAERFLGVGEDDVILSVPRLSFSFGIGIAMGTPLWLGATVILDPRRQTTETFRELIGRFAPTLFAAVPTAYAKLLAEADLRASEVASLRLCLSGGEATPPELVRRWQALCGQPILEVVGSTEVGFIYIGMPPGQVHPATSGKPVTGYRVRIVDGAGNDVSGETPGRLLVRGQGVMKRYWNNPEKTAAVLVDGWFDTGDVFLCNAEGNYVFCGRGGDVFKSSARWISPFEIESAITRHPSVLEAAVVQRSDELGLPKPEAWIVLASGEVPSKEIADEIRDICRGQLAPYKFPHWIRFTEELPKTATGKVQRFMLRNSSAAEETEDAANAKD